MRQPDKWRGYDPALFDALALAPATPTIEDFLRVENEALIPSAIFFNEFTSDGLERFPLRHIQMGILRG